MNGIPDSISSLLPKAIDWARQECNRVSKEGEPLVPDWMDIARQVGVSHPERIRIALVDHMPIPDDQEVRDACDDLKLLGPNAVGLTLGYAILIRKGMLSRQVVAHECRHVNQFEDAGSLDGFLTIYISQIIEHGYLDAPMEVDARRFEVC